MHGTGHYLSAKRLWFNVVPGVGPPKAFASGIDHPLSRAVSPASVRLDIGLELFLSIGVSG
jgi:hypothetical protein